MDTASNKSSRAVLCAAAAGAAAGGLGLLLWRLSRPTAHGEATQGRAASTSPSTSETPSSPSPPLHPSFAPIDSVAELLRQGAAEAVEVEEDDNKNNEPSAPSPSPPPPPAAVVPLPAGAPRTADDLATRRADPPPLLLCHDMMGGYLPYETATRGTALPLEANHPPPAPQVDAAADAPCSPRDLALLLPSESAFATADLFVYFSHRLVTIPPRGWISAGHRHGVPVLGTLIVEGGGVAGRRAADALFGAEEGDDEDDDEGEEQEEAATGGLGALLGSWTAGVARGVAARWAAGRGAPPLSATEAKDAAAEQLPPARDRPAALAAALARLARRHGFDGYLINVEVALSKGQARRCLAFVRELRAALEAGVVSASSSSPATADAPPPATGGAFVVWYDAVCTDGRLEWQDALTTRNARFFDAAGLIFTNYKWKRETPGRCAELARARGALPFSPSSDAAAANDLASSSSCNPRRVLMGVDVYGRGAYGGGGDGTDVALAAARAAGVGAALFGVGWTWEHGGHRPRIDRGEHGSIARRWWSRVRRAWWYGGGGGASGSNGGGGNGNGNGNGSNGGGASSVGSSWARVSDSSAGGGSEDNGGAAVADSSCCRRPLAWRLPFSTNFNAGAWLRLYPAPPAAPPAPSSSLLWRGSGGGGGGGASQGGEGAAAAAVRTHPGASRPWCDLACQEPLPQAVVSSPSSSSSAPPPVLLDFSDGFGSGSCLRLLVGGALPPPSSSSGPRPSAGGGGGSSVGGTAGPTPPLRLFELAIEVPPASAGGAREVVVRAAIRRAEQQQQGAARLAVVLWGRRREEQPQQSTADQREEEILWTGPAWEAGPQWQAREAVARLAGRAGVVVTAVGVAVVVAPAPAPATAAAAAPPPALLLGHLSLRAPRSPVPAPAAAS